MNEAHPAKSPKFLRDQFILVAILVVALVCRNAFVSSHAQQADMASQSQPTEPGTIASAK